MSKTITIPTNCNPYIVVINNHVYTYKAGDTIEVPDEVAEAIEDAIELVPKPKRYLDMYERYIEGSISEITADDLANVRKISGYAFYKYDSLTKITIPKGVTSIENSSFRSCAYLTRVDISEDVSTIGTKVLGDCVRLERVVVRRVTPPSIQEDTFVNVPITCVFEVPSEALEAYKSATYWSAIANQIKAIEE